ncbi:MFS transporter [Fodinicola acaciae]|uniref:MFS transporter n=1 Tax=Fodinicola acaciae TaxID=2681555 RepID=UPI0013D1875E|nr:MFS transporter [Fodinicola acaciae]
MARTDTAPRALSTSGQAVAVAYVFGTVLTGSTLPTPLYPLYQREWQFGSLVTTLVFAVYAAGVLAGLLAFGRASDLLGRRPVIVTAVVVSALSDLIFLTDLGLPALFAGRVVSGLSIGLITAAATVSIIELAPARHRRLATMAATAVNMLGLGCGPLLAGVLADLAPAPLRLPFGVHLALLGIAAVLAWRMPETVRGAERPRLGNAVRPQLPAVPRSVRAVFVPAAVAVFAAFAVFGLLTATGAGLLAGLLHQPAHVVVGVLIFAMFAASSVAQLGSLRWPPRRALPAGCLLLVLGAVAIGAAMPAGSVVLLAAGTVLAGLGQGLCFRSAMATVTQHSPAERRAETVSALTVTAYVGISVPVVLVGTATTTMTLYDATTLFAAIVAVVVLVAMAVIVRVQSSSRMP